MRSTDYAHIVLDDSGQPCLSGTRLRVRAIAAEYSHWLMSAEAIQRQHPEHTLAEVYGALAYYHDHKDEIDRQLAQQLSEPYTGTRMGGMRLDDIDAPSIQRAVQAMSTVFQTEDVWEHAD